MVLFTLWTEMCAKKLAWSFNMCSILHRLNPWCLGGTFPSVGSWAALPDSYKVRTFQHPIHEIVLGGSRLQIYRFIRSPPGRCCRSCCFVYVVSVSVALCLLLDKDAVTVHNLPPVASGLRMSIYILKYHAHKHTYKRTCTSTHHLSETRLNIVAFLVDILPNIHYVYHTRGYRKNCGLSSLHKIYFSYWFENLTLPRRIKN
jgi:hypothetical protein